MEDKYSHKSKNIKERNAYNLDKHLNCLKGGNSELIFICTLRGQNTLKPFTDQAHCLFVEQNSKLEWIIIDTNGKKYNCLDDDDSVNKLLSQFV